MERIELSKTFDIFNLQMIHLRVALKNEVGLIQGHRRRKFAISAEIKDASKNVHDKLNSGDGDTFMKSKVFKMKSRPLNQSHPFVSAAQQKPYADADYITMKQELEIVFKGFCATNGINIIEMEGPFRQHHSVKEHGGRGGGGGGGADPGGGKSVSFHGGSSPHGGENGGNSTQNGAAAGGNGGGKRPPRKRSRHFSSNESKSESTTQDDDTLSPSELEHSSASTSSAITKTSVSTSASTVEKGHHPQRKRPTQKEVHHPENPKRSRVMSKSKSPSASEETSQSTDESSHPASKKVHNKSIAKGRSKRTTSTPSNSPLNFAKGEWKAGQLDSPEHSPPEFTGGASHHSLGAIIHHDSHPPPGKQPPQKKKQQKVKHLKTVRIRPSKIPTRQIQTERDSQWLKWTSSESSYDEDADEQEGFKKGRKTRIKLEVQQDLRLFLDSTKVLDNLNSFLGLYPYKKILTGNQCVEVKWQPKSCEFLGVCFNSGVFFMSALSIFYSLIIIFTYDEGHQSTTHNIIKLDFANHFTEALFMLILTLFLSIWSISCVMELGGHYAAFFSRFNLGISHIKYDVTEGVQKMIVTQLITVAFFLLAIAGLFFGGRDKVECVREMFGFVGFCMLRPFNFRLRESPYFPLAEIVGLLVFSYCFFCLNVVLLQFLVYAKALGNMAKMWNLRLAFALGDISMRTGKKEAKQLKKAIPFHKLHAEHLVIVSLFRNLGHVNSIVFNGFALCVSLEIVLVIFLLFAMYTEAPPPPVFLERKYLEDDGDLSLPVPLRLHQTKGEEIFKALILLALTMSAFWLFGGVLHSAADNLHVGIEYIRRHGLITCKSSKERRFILSMINSYCPKRAYWIGRGFNFNREFLLALLAFVIGVSMVTVEFSPERTALNQLTSCDASGKCTIISIPRSAVHLAYEIAGVIPPSQEGLKHHGPEAPPSSPTAPDPDPELEEKYLHNFLFELPCKGTGINPFKQLQAATKCVANWTNMKEITLPTIYKPVKHDETILFGEILEPFGSNPEIVPTKCRTEGQTSYNFPYDLTFGEAPAGSMLDCFGNELNEPTFHLDGDDCGNLPFKSANEFIQPQDSILRIVVTSEVEGIPKENESIICCYEYPGYSESEMQVKVCNMPDPSIFQKVCKFGKERKRMAGWGHVWKLHNRILARIQYEKESKGNINFVKDNENPLKECLCRLQDPQVESGSKDHCVCSGMGVLPCLSLATSTKKLENEEYAIKCGAVWFPILFKTNLDKSLVFPSEHKRYGEVCNEEEFKDTLFHTDDLTYNNPCNSGGSPLNLVDCAGNKFVLGDANKDDCSNWRISTPDEKEGKLTPPKVSIKAFNYKPSEKKIIYSVSRQKAFLCCFQFASQPFQTGDQKKNCNAPNLVALNKNGWCKKIVDNNGRREPGAFVDKEKYEQLHKKLELTVEFHRRSKRNNWLDGDEINEKWSRCMCSNKIEGFGGSTEWEVARGACIPLIATPFNLYKRREADLLDPFPKCKHSWPNFPKLGFIMNPQVFLKVNGIWELPHRYQKIGNPSSTSKCYSDQSFEERYTNEGTSPVLLDLNLVSIKRNQKDDCGNLPVGNPKKIIIAEFTFHQYEKKGGSEFISTDWIHCCYNYFYKPAHDDQYKVCNLPNPASVKKKCRNPLRRQMRRKHEKELARRLTISSFGAHFKGNLVPPKLDLDGKGEEAMRKCVCQNSKSQADNERCEKLYLPPCMIPKGEVNKDIVKPEETFTQCPTSSSTWSRGSLRLPILMKTQSDPDFKTTFKPVELFQDKTVKSKKFLCPNDGTEFNLGGASSTLVDCYGATLDLSSPTKGFDDCKNPNVATPSQSDLTLRKYPKLELIAGDQLPGGSGGGGDNRIFCCFSYPIAEDNEQVQVCNKFSKANFENECKDRLLSETDQDIRQAIQKLKDERAKDPNADVLKPSVPFTNGKRMKWTKCICNREKIAC